MMKTEVVFTISLLLVFFVSFGQDSVPHLRKHAIKFSPLHALNPEARSVQVAYEYRFLPTVSVQVDAGYVFDGVWWSYPAAEATGFKLKEDLRWYFLNRIVSKNAERHAYRGMYLAFELHQNRLTFANDTGDRYRQNGIGIKSGFMTYATWHFVFDLNAGFALARTNMPPLGIPLNNTEAGRNGHTALLPIIGARLGYAIR